MADEDDDNYNVIIIMFFVIIAFKYGTRVSNSKYKQSIHHQLHHQDNNEGNPRKTDVITNSHPKTVCRFVNIVNSNVIGVSIGIVTSLYYKKTTATN
jgi:hypothetical protein